MKGASMRRLILIAFLMCLPALFVVAYAGQATQQASDQSVFPGYTQQSAAEERQWEEKFRAIPSPDNQRRYMQRLSARPHHVRSEEHTSELQSPCNLVCRLLLEKN